MDNFATLSQTPEFAQELNDLLGQTLDEVRADFPTAEAAAAAAWNGLLRGQKVTTHGPDYVYKLAPGGQAVELDCGITETMSGARAAAQIFVAASDLGVTHHD